ncbi:site-2 protease family protein [Nocardia sp. NPDC051832]|uniref:site-2 protease family protein n=1 Tax=Nocardia sp. NPDC051832 TaxID=3155673 RepID=UPI0034470B5C
MTYSFPQRRAAVRPSPVFLAVVAVTVAGGVLAWIAEPNSNLARVGVFLMVVAGWVVTLCLHEFAHAFTAWRAGDQDVEMRGYLTLNPLKYSHPLLSIVLPIVFIALGGIGLPGGAVYVHSHNFSPRIQRLISFSGPAVNLVCGIVMLAIVRLFAPEPFGFAAEPGSGRLTVELLPQAPFWLALSFLAFLQITAFVLNILPVPGMDGYGVLEPSLSYKTRQTLDQFKPFGMLILFALLFTPQINRVFFDSIYWLFELSGVPSYWSGQGSRLFRFWT